MHVVLIFSMWYFSPSMPYLPRDTISAKNSSLGGDPCPTPCAKRSPCDRLSPGPGESFTCDQRKIIFVWFEMMYWLVLWNMAGLWLSHHIGNVIIPTDFNSIIFQRGRYTSNQILYSYYIIFWGDEPTIYQRYVGVHQGELNGTSDISMDFPRRFCWHNFWRFARCPRFDPVSIQTLAVPAAHRCKVWWWKIASDIFRDGARKDQKRMNFCVVGGY